MGAYHFLMRVDQGSTQVHTLGGGGAVPPPATILPSWRSWCARPPEEREDAVRFGGSAPIAALVIWGLPCPSKAERRVRFPCAAPFLFPSTEQENGAAC